jgi:hypothetical protein
MLVSLTLSLPVPAVILSSPICRKCGTRQASAEGVPATFPLEAGMRIAHISAGPSFGMAQPDQLTLNELN